MHGDDRRRQAQATGVAFARRRVGARIRDVELAVHVLGRHGQRVLDGRHRARHDREDLQVQRVGPQPLQQRRIFRRVRSIAGQLLVARCRRAALHQVAVVPSSVRADAQAGRRRAGGQLDLEAGLIGDRARIREHPAHGIDGNAVVDADVDGVRDLDERLLARRLQDVGTRRARDGAQPARERPGGEPGDAHTR